MVDAAHARANRLLAALPPNVLEGVIPYLTQVDLSLGEPIYEAGAPFADLYFPTSSLVSLLHVLENGATTEIAIVGNDGVVGVTLFMGGATSSTRGVVQAAGSALKLPYALLRNEFEKGRAVSHLLLRYTQALMSQMTQTAACNRHHTIEQQLCRWLLLSLDRLDGAEVNMTQELISNMLGVRREGVTHAAAKLQNDGVIRYARGHITILDREGLEQRSCECYEAVRREQERLLPRAQASP